jgi:uncharacterized 2Fe-2S/4Fe-4S cluster protein (DUF4445 family)
MRGHEVPVSIQPHGKKVFVLPGTPLLEAAARAGLVFNAPCGGQGTCGKCRVRVIQGAQSPTPAEREHLSEVECSEGVRLACQSTVYTPTVIDVPETSLLGSTYQILGSAPDVVQEILPAVHKHYVELPLPSREDPEADVERLQRTLPPFDLSLDLLRELPERLRRFAFKGTAVMADGRLIDLEEGDTTADCCAVAFDVGTTTVVGALVDLHTGRELASAARMNPQTRYGDDVLSRILHVRERKEGLADLHAAIMATLNEIVAEVTTEAGISRHHVYEATLSGNTTMQHLALGLSPAALGEMPFTAVHRRPLLVDAAGVGLRLHPMARLYAFSCMGGFLGGDTVAGLLATAFAAEEGPALFVDIGTNGEIVVVHDGRLVATSTAAGPAFEGARIRHGMRAAAGAIEKVVLRDDVELNVIGDIPPVGLCGSALIDLAAELLRQGLLLPQGVILSADQAPDSVPEALTARLVTGEGGTGFILATADESGTGAPIVLTPQDVRELQLATAAIRAGTATLLNRLGLTPGDLRKILVAGGFGNFIRRSNAQCIGLLPGGVPHERIIYAGNASLNGARLAAISRKARAQAEAIAEGVEHIDLSQDRFFHDAYVEAMFFPDVCPQR